MTKPEPLDLKKIVDEIVRIEYPTYEKSQLASHVKQLKFKIKLILEQRLKSACEFFLRYKDEPELLVKEQKKSISEWRENIYKWCKMQIERKDECKEFIVWAKEGWWIHSGITHVGGKKEYNLWLFKIAFKSVFK
ncbi:MAG: hypothetical protein ACTSVB_04030 [Candidatus Heimdallarchaeaceae archaeon]